MGHDVATRKRIAQQGVLCAWKRSFYAIAAFWQASTMKPLPRGKADLDGVSATTRSICGRVKPDILAPAWAPYFPNDSHKMADVIATGESCWVNIVAFSHRN